MVSANPDSARNARRYRTIYIDISGKILTAADPVTADLANALVALRGGH
ncbi:hypothetical protein [Gordonia sp. FQ]